MKLYQLFDGTVIGCYQEYGGAVECVMYRDVYETKVITKKVEKEITVSVWRAGLMIPGHWVETTRLYYVPEYEIELFRIVPGEWGTETVYVPGYYETQTIWIPEHTEYRLEEIPGRYEILPVWFEAYFGTKYYWREAHPARGLPAAWIPYRGLISAGYRDTRVWVDAHWHNVPFTVPGEFRPHRVWVDGNYEDQSVWIPAHEEMYTEVVPAREELRTERYYKYAHFQPAYREMVTKKITVIETTIVEVWVGYEPVWSYVDPALVYGYEVIDLTPAPTDQPGVPDQITIKNKLTGEESVTTAKFMGMATKVADNEYVLPLP